MGQQVPRTLSGTATADGTGRAEVDLGQVPSACSWRNVSIQVTSNSALLTSATVYKGFVDQPSNQLDPTGPFGGNGNTSSTAWVLNAGDQLRVVWTGATPGARCSSTCQVIQTFA